MNGGTIPLSRIASAIASHIFVLARASPANARFRSCSDGSRSQQVAQVATGTQTAEELGVPKVINENVGVTTILVSVGTGVNPGLFGVSLGPGVGVSGVTPGLGVLVGSPGGGTGSVGTTGTVLVGPPGGTGSVGSVVGATGTEVLVGSTGDCVLVGTIGAEVLVGSGTEVLVGAGPTQGPL